MLEHITTLPAERVQKIKAYLEEHVRPHLERDVSSYARGRERVWLQYEWDLKERVFRQGLKLGKLWRFCKEIYPEAQLGLISRGAIGITAHRDDSYANYKAYGINLGQCKWQYNLEYPGYMWVPNSRKINPPEITVMNMTGGEVIRFNCKNLHAALECSEDRWSINLWTVSPKFLDALKNQEEKSDEDHIQL